MARSSKTTRSRGPISGSSSAWRRRPPDSRGYDQALGWDRLAEIAGRDLRKRQLVAVEGRLQTRSWDDDRGWRHWKTEVIAQRGRDALGKGMLRETPDVVGAAVQVDPRRAVLLGHCRVTRASG